MIAVNKFLRLFMEIGAVDFLPVAAPLIKYFVQSEGGTLNEAFIFYLVSFF